MAFEVEVKDKTGLYPLTPQSMYLKVDLGRIKDMSGPELLYEIVRRINKARDPHKEDLEAVVISGQQDSLMIRINTEKWFSLKEER